MQRDVYAKAEGRTTSHGSPWIDIYALYTRGYWDLFLRGGRRPALLFQSPSNAGAIYLLMQVVELNNGKAKVR
jgi:hypothetical protein